MRLTLDLFDPPRYGFDFDLICLLFYCTCGFVFNHFFALFLYSAVFSSSFLSSSSFFAVVAVSSLSNFKIKALHTISNIVDPSDASFLAMFNEVFNAEQRGLAGLWAQVTGGQRAPEGNKKMK